MARKRSSKPHTYTGGSPFGPVTVVELPAPSPKERERFERLLKAKSPSAREEPPAPPRKAVKRMTADERTELARAVLGACFALARRYGEEMVVCGRSITEVHAGRFMIWLTAWDSEVSGLDIWLAAEGGRKLLDLLWSGDDIEIRTFKRVVEWAPELIGLAQEKVGLSLH